MLPTFFLVRNAISPETDLGLNQETYYVYSIMHFQRFWTIVRHFFQIQELLRNIDPQNHKKQGALRGPKYFLPKKKRDCLQYNYQRIDTKN